MPCPRGKLVKKLLNETPGPNVVPLHNPKEVEARTELVTALMTYCVVKCGGCELTEGWAPP